MRWSLSFQPWLALRAEGSSLPLSAVRNRPGAAVQCSASGQCERRRFDIQCEGRMYKYESGRTHVRSPEIIIKLQDNSQYIN